MIVNAQDIKVISVEEKQYITAHQVEQIRAEVRLVAKAEGRDTIDVFRDLDNAFKFRAYKNITESQLPQIKTTLKDWKTKAGAAKEINDRQR